MAVARHLDVKLPAFDLLVIKAEGTGEARKLGLIRRLLQHEVDEEGEQPERNGEADQPPNDGNALDQHDQQRGAKRIKREMLPFGDGMGHHPTQILPPASTFKPARCRSTGQIDAAGEIFGTSEASRRWANMNQFAPIPLVREGVVTVGLAKGRDGGLLLPTFAHAWPVERAAPFEELLSEIDEAECEFA